MSLFWVYFVFDQLLKQTICDKNFTEMILDSIGKWQVIKTDTLC